MSLTTFRQTLITQFTTDVAIPFTAGKPGAAFRVSPDRAIGFVYPQSVDEVSGRVNEEEIRMTVEIYDRYAADPSLENPADPAPLESFMDLLKASVKAHQTGQGPWFQRVQSVIFDHDRQMLTATVYARETNASIL